MALYHHIDIGAGVVDEDFHGNLTVILLNHSEKTFTVSRGDKIAKLICEKIYYPELDIVKELDVSWRGTGGLGLTGQN